MQCPRCGFVDAHLEEGCPRCGYARATPSLPPPQALRPLPRTSGNLLATSGPLAKVPPRRLKAGMTLNKRYHLERPHDLPNHLQDQGEAWIALDTGTSTRPRVTIREVPLFTVPPDQRAQTFQNIIQTLQSMNGHPALPDVLATFGDGENYYLVLQYMSGERLSSLMQRHGGALPEAMVAEYGRQLCDILTFFARQRPPFIHGALSPDLILVDPTERQISLAYYSLTLPDATNSTRSMLPARPSGYHAPEQARTGVMKHAGVDISADLYTVAAIMHHALTGFDPTERMAFFYPPARRLNPRVSVVMQEILSHQLRLSIGQRYARASDMRADLSRLLSSHTFEQEEEQPAAMPTNLLSGQVPRRGRGLRTYIQQRGRISNLIIALISLLVLLLIFGSILVASFFQQQNVKLRADHQAALLDIQAREKKLYERKHIGLSDGRYPFDLYGGRTNIDAKKQAAESLMHNNLTVAASQLDQAVQSDPTDGEARIYQENVRILRSGTPYLTLVFGVCIDENDGDLGPSRSQLQGAYLAQRQINEQHLLPGGRQLRIMIDNSGASRSDVVAAASFILNRMDQAGNPDKFVGVVGWPFSAQTLSARDVIAEASLPLISTTASSVDLSGNSRYFFRVNPPDDQQGRTLSTFATSSLHAHTILVLRDKDEPYSVSLADAFTRSAREQGVQIVDGAFRASTTTIEDYQNVVNQVANGSIDMIFLAGFDVDAIRLASALGRASSANPTNVALANMKILGGDALGTNLLLGLGSGADAELAKQNPRDMQRLVFSSFAHPDEWNRLNIPSNKQPAFFQNWQKLYQSAPPPSFDAILAADAVQVTAYATTLVSGEITGDAVRDILARHSGSQTFSYQGISGRISFDVDGNPVNKALVILKVDGKDGKNAIALLDVIGKFQ